MNTGKIITALRDKKEWSQAQLADNSGVSRVMIGKYERGEAVPSIDAAKKIADALDTNVDFLVNGSTSDKANASLLDAEVIRYFKEVDTLPTEEKSALLRVIGGFIRDVKAKQAYAS